MEAHGEGRLPGRVSHVASEDSQSGKQWYQLVICLLTDNKKNWTITSFALLSLIIILFVIYLDTENDGLDISNGISLPPTKEEVNAFVCLSVC